MVEVQLQQFDESIHSWASVAEEPLPLQAHKFDSQNCTLLVLDQRLLPQRSEFVPVRTLKDGFDAIKEMKVRGAPLIATVGMLTLLVEQHLNVVGPSCCSADEFFHQLEANCQFLLSARPTAINLANAFAELVECIRQLKEELEDKAQQPCEGSNIGSQVDQLKSRVRDFVLNWQAHERHSNDKLLRNAVHGVLGAVEKRRLVVMSICNTGQLATSSFGTALGVILMLHRLGHLEMALLLETRPYNQGSRLSAYELQQAKVPFRLIADSAAAAAMRQFQVDVVLAGADQIALNGDTANKIGTYSLAILARHHQIPFFVVTPIESVNRRLANGHSIRVEERPAQELTHWNGVPSCPADCPVWNPAFDITPSELISGFLTEEGNLQPEIGRASCRERVSQLV